MLRLLAGHGDAPAGSADSDTTTMVEAIRRRAIRRAWTPRNRTTRTTIERMKVRYFSDDSR